MPGTPADLTREVQSCLELMRATRAELADRLAHSQGVCEQMIAGCQQGAAQQGEQEPAAFGSPAAAESPERAQPEAAEERKVLGVSQRHTNALFDASPSASSKLSASSGWGGSSCSPGASAGSVAGARGQGDAVQARVAEARARCSAWDLAGFVRELGFQVSKGWEMGGVGHRGPVCPPGPELLDTAHSPPPITHPQPQFEDAAVPVDREQFDSLKELAQGALQAAKAAAEQREERALATAALRALEQWDWPLQRVNTPPPSPFWRLLGLES